MHLRRPIFLIQRIVKKLFQTDQYEWNDPKVEVSHKNELWVEQPMRPLIKAAENVFERRSSLGIEILSVHLRSYQT